jgi:hypothetical protein
MVAVSLAGALPLAHWLWQPARAANPPVDAGLLEFLGSVDSDDEDWHRYLAAANRRRMSGDAVDPAAGDHATSQPPAPANKPAGSSGPPSANPTPQNAAPAPSQPSGTDGSGHSSPSGVNHT